MCIRDSIRLTGTVALLDKRVKSVVIVGDGFPAGQLSAHPVAHFVVGVLREKGEPPPSLLQCKEEALSILRSCSLTLLVNTIVQNLF